MHCHQTGGQNDYTKTANKPFDNAAKIKHGNDGNKS
jgi:hypothetical protein